MQAADFERLFGLNDDDSRTWAPLSHLTALTSLVVGAGVGSRLPAQLAACTALAELRVGWHVGRVWNAAIVAWAPLRHLAALTKYGGPFAPAALPLLPASLRDLRPRCSLPVTSQAELAALSRLTALTRLDLSEAMLALIPTSLLGCSALRELLLAQTGYGVAHCRRLPEAAFQPLAHLTALTRLSLEGLQLAAVPPALAAATALLDLELSSNDWWRFSRAARQPELSCLSRLSSLIHLQVGCSWSWHSCLFCVRLDDGPLRLCEAGDCAFPACTCGPAPADALPLFNRALWSCLPQRLVLSNRGTQRLPRQLSTLHITCLVLSRCDAMGQVRLEARSLGIWVHTTCCEPQVGVPPAQAVGIWQCHLFLSLVRLQSGSAAFETLRHMTALRELHLVDTMLRAVPSPVRGCSTGWSQGLQHCSSWIG